MQVTWTLLLALLVGIGGWSLKKVEVLDDAIADIKTDVAVMKSSHQAIQNVQSQVVEVLKQHALNRQQIDQIDRRIDRLEQKNPTP
jgi:prefoldin subunit 5